MEKHRLPRRVYNWEIRRRAKKCWTTYTEEILEELGLQAYWNKQEVEENKEEWNNLIFERIQAREQKVWWKSIKTKSKLRTYRKVKTKLEFEKYLESDDKQGRRFMAKLRSGTNSLRIETGRRQGLKSSDRLCWFGCGVTEDEEHFLLDCYLYDDIRKEITAKLGKGKPIKLELSIMMGKGNKEETKLVYEIIQRAMSKRNRVLAMKAEK